MRAWLFFIPYVISLYFKEVPDTQYWICWGGSFWIFLVTFMGWVNPLPKDLTFAQQFMRPFIFAHLLCAGYMALSSVFYFIHYHGYFYLWLIAFTNASERSKNWNYLSFNFIRYRWLFLSFHQIKFRNST